MPPYAVPIVILLAGSVLNDLQVPTTVTLVADDETLKVEADPDIWRLIVEVPTDSIKHTLRATLEDIRLGAKEPEQDEEGPDRD
jgi:hypothetical protein